MRGRNRSRRAGHRSQSLRGEGSLRTGMSVRRLRDPTARSGRPRCAVAAREGEGVGARQPPSLCRACGGLSCLRSVHQGLSGAGNTLDARPALRQSRRHRDAADPRRESRVRSPWCAGRRRPLSRSGRSGKPVIRCGPVPALSPGRRARRARRSSLPPDVQSACRSDSGRCPSESRRPDRRCGHRSHAP